MTTPIIMLALLTGPYLATRVLAVLTGGRFDFRAAAAIGLGILFIFTGVGHFIRTEAMAQMLPPWTPLREPLVYLTGMLELALALGLLIPSTRLHAGRCAAVLLILLFPANVYAAVFQVPMGGHARGPEYLLIRAPLQAFIWLWAYWFTIHPAPTPRGEER